MACYHMLVGFTTTCGITWNVPITAKVVISNSVQSWRDALDTTCDQVYQLLATGLRFSAGTQLSSTSKTDRHDITEILLKVVLKAS